MGSGRQPFQRRSSKMSRSMPLAILILLAVSAQGARIFRNPEPHLPAENVPSASGYAEVHSSASDPRSAAVDDSFFAPGAWRPVRDPDLSSSGRRRVSSLATSGHAGNLQVASARNLQLEDEKSAGSVEARTSPPSANSPTTTLGHSIALVANQLLQGSDIMESRSPGGSTTTSVSAGSWPHAPLDVRTPPKLMLQISGQKNAETKDEEPKKNAAPVNDDPMGENFFPSRRHPPGVTQHVATTVTQMTVSAGISKEGEQKLPSSSSTVVSLGNKKDEKRPSTSFVSSRKPVTTSTTPTPVTTPTTPTSVRWKIAIPPNRPARFPPRKPATPQPAAGSTANGNNDILKKDNNKPSNSVPTNFRPSINSGGITRPASFLASSRQPTPTIVRDTTTPRPVATTPRVIVKSTSSIPFSVPTTTTTSTTQSSVTTTSGSTITTTSATKPTTTQQTRTSSTTPPLNKEVIEVKPKKPSGIEKEIGSISTVTEVIKTDIASTVENKEETPSTTTPRPRRPSNKRKKNKNRRRRPSSKKPANSQQADASSSGTELEVKESPQEDNSGSVASPLSTRIYNFIAREVMPSMSVGLLGLVVTAGLAGYFLLPTLGGLQRRSDVADSLVTGYGSGSSYTSGQDDDGGIMASIFQNVMASVRNGENEFERGPRRKRRNVIQADETENEVDAALDEKDNRFGQQTLLTLTTTPVSETDSPHKDLTNDQMTEHSLDASGIEPHVVTSTEGSGDDDEGATTTEEAIKNVNPSQELTPTYEWDVQHDDNPFSLMGILRRIADFKIRIGVGLLRATTDVIARYLEDVQKRLRDSDRHEWLRDLGSTIRRIGRSIDPPPMDSDEDHIVPYPRKRFSRLRRTRRQS